MCILAKAEICHFVHTHIDIVLSQAELKLEEESWNKR